MEQRIDISILLTSSLPPSLKISKLRKSQVCDAVVSGVLTGMSTVTTVSFRAFSSSQREALSPVALPPPPSARTSLTSVFIDCLVLDVSCEWNLCVCVCVCVCVRARIPFLRVAFL